VYYRLTEKGGKATLAEVSNPLKTLYPNFNEEYYREKRRNRRYYTRRDDFYAEGNMPSEPASTDASSLIISPKRLLITRTS